MEYLYTTLEVRPAGSNKPYVFDIVAEDSVKLDIAVEDAVRTTSIWGGMAPSDEPDVRWSGENEIAEEHLEQYIHDVENREGHASSHVDQIFKDLGHKGWAYITMP